MTAMRMLNRLVKELREEERGHEDTSGAMNEIDEPVDEPIGENSYQIASYRTTKSSAAVIVKSLSKNVNLSSISKETGARKLLPGITELHDNSYAWFHTSVKQLEECVDRCPSELRRLAGPYRWLPFMYACRNGAHPDVARRLIEYFPHCVLVAEEDGWLPTHYAAYSGNTEVLSLLLDACPLSAYARNKDGNTPMYLAKEQQKWVSVTLLKRHYGQQEKLRIRHDEKFSRWYGANRPKEDLYQNTTTKYSLPWYAPSLRTGGHVLKIFYCTTRSATATAKDNQYANKRAHNGDGLSLHHGQIECFVPGTKRPVNQIMWQFDRVVPLIESNETESVFTKTFFGEYRDWNHVGVNDMRQSLTNERSMLLFVHGYDTTFSESLLMLAQLVDDVQFNGTPCMFSWSSQGDPKSYTVDEASVSSCEDALTKYILDLADVLEMAFVEFDTEEMDQRTSRGDGKLHIFAHSMGARCVLQALGSLAHIATFRPALKEIIGSVILTVPDVDLDAYNRKIEVVRQLTKRVTVYTSEKDESLRLSEEIHEYPRLGRQPTASKKVLHGDVLSCGKYYHHFVPGATQTNKYSLVGSARLCFEVMRLLNIASTEDERQGEQQNLRRRLVH